MTVRWNAEPTLQRPALVAAFSGWNDAADAATDAVRLARTRVRSARPFASLDPEEYIDFQARVPPSSSSTASFAASNWPALAFSAGSPPARRDLVLLLGVEPNLRWPTFCDDVIGVARTTGCEMIVTLGALLGDTPHSRPVHVHGVGHRRGARRPPRHGAVALRGADRHRRRAARRRARAPGSRRRRSGRRYRTTSRRRRTRRRAAPARPAARSSSTSISTSPISTSPPARGSGRSSEVVAGDADVSGVRRTARGALRHRGRRTRRGPPRINGRGRRRRRRRGLVRRGRPPVRRVPRRRLRALPPRPDD